MLTKSNSPFWYIKWNLKTDVANGWMKSEIWKNIVQQFATLFDVFV
jgi:hypothetical protein